MHVGTLQEEPDEISFRIGETILLLEDDALYNDGWFKVRTSNMWRAVANIRPSLAVQGCGNRWTSNASVLYAERATCLI